MCLVTNIQKYSIHDGDGIRTTVFFKGCPLRCAWCHNPETQKWKRQILTNQEKCTGCMECERVCPNGAVRIENGKAVTDYEKCTGCGECVTACLLNIREVAGKEYTIKELLKELKKDEMFYEESGGGVTLSGGEVCGHNDHRIVMAAAVAATAAAAPVTITGAEAVRKSYPSFWEEYKRLGGEADVL